MSQDLAAPRRTSQGDLRNWLEEEILEGRFRPGERLDEQAIGRQFKVSRTPVREALLQLASLGLVTFQPRQGPMVAVLSVKQIVAMWEVFTRLEGLCAEFAARRMTPAERVALQAMHQRMATVLKSGDAARYDKANRLFHEAIYQGGRNEFLTNQLKDIRRRLRVYGRYPFQRAGGMARSYATHGVIVAAIVAGQEAAAEAAMREHVVSGLSFLDFVAELPKDAD
jgi:DNA-binding GntR family transcriptional regulator